MKYFTLAILVLLLLVGCEPEEVITIQGQDIIMNEQYPEGINSPIGGGCGVGVS